MPVCFLLLCWIVTFDVTSIFLACIMKMCRLHTLETKQDRPLPRAERKQRQLLLQARLEPPFMVIKITSGQ